MKTLIYNIGLLATAKGNCATAEQGSVQFLKDAYILCENGTITEVGTGTPPETDG